MLKHEFEKLEKVKKDKEVILTIDDLTNKEERTLLYGYTCERETWHVYVKNNQIHTVIYKLDGRVQPLEVERNKDYVPDKRLYPEKCDFEFCSLLKKKGIKLNFTTWEDIVPTEKYYGRTI